MKYVSELTGKSFNTEKECLEDDELFKQKNLKEQEEKELHKKKVEEASNNLSKAYENYELARKHAAEILEKSNKEVEAILSDAEKQVDLAKKKLSDLRTKNDCKPDSSFFEQILRALFDD